MKRSNSFALCLIALASSVFAQSQDVVILNVFMVKSDRDRGYQSQESISGSRFAIELKNAPFTLDVLSRELLDDIGAVRLEDALQYSTGTVAYEHINTDETLIFQRGFSTGLMLRNGIRRPGTFDTTGVERIEVVKGPSSVLFGITNPGGTVNYISKSPLAKQASSFRQTFGSFNTYRTEIDSGGPLNETASVRYRLPASFNSTDGARRYNDLEKVYLAPTVLLQLARNLTAEFQLEYLKSHGIPDGAVPAIITAGQQRVMTELPRDWTGNTPEHFADFSGVLPSLTVNAALGDHWQVRSTTSFYKRDREVFNHARGATQAPALLSFRQSQHIRTVDKNFQQIVDLAGTFEVPFGKLKFVAGAEFRDDYSKDHRRSSLVPGSVVPVSWQLLDPSTWNYNERVFSTLPFSSATRTSFESTAYSAMGQAEMLDKRLILSGGFRRDDTETDFSSATFSSNGFVRSRFEPGKTSYQMGALFKLLPQLSVYANHSTSFEPILSTFVDSNNQPYAPVPVEGKGTEVGFKSELLQGRVIQTLGFFEIELTNINARLLKVASETNTFVYDSQSGVQRSRGMEYSVNVAMSENFAILGGYSYTDAEVIRDLANPTFVGMTLPNAYKHKFNAFGKYTFRSGPLDGFFIGAGYVHVSSAPFAIGVLQSLKIPGHGVANLLAGYQNMKWSVQLNVDNVFDEDYFTFINYRADPRNVKVSVSLKL